MTEREIDRLTTMMSQEMRDEIDAVVFFQCLCHEILIEYRRHGIEAGQNFVSIEFNDKCCWLHLYHLATPQTFKHKLVLMLDTFCIDAEFPEVEIFTGKEDGEEHTLFLGDPQFIEKAERVIREAIREKNRKALVYHYHLIQGTYYLLKDEKIGNLQNNIISASDEIAICYAHDKKDDTYILHKHGNPINVHKWAKETREAYRRAGMEDMAKSITVIEGKFPLDEINTMLDNTGYIKAFLRKFNFI